jgi:hypothetical protein
LQGQQAQQQYGYNAQDLGTQQQRLQQDYQSQVQALGRQYAQLGTAQRQSAQQAGVANGGYFAGANRVRTANQAIDRQPLDTSYQRGLQDIQTQRERQQTGLQQALAGIDLGRSQTFQDYGIQSGRAADQQQLGLGNLSLGYERGNEDLATQLARAARENAYYGQDARAAAYQQAAAYGYVPPMNYRRRR